VTPRWPSAAIGDEPVPIGEPDEDGEFDDGDEDDEEDEEDEDDEPMQARGCGCTSVAPGPRLQA